MTFDEWYEENMWGVDKDSAKEGWNAALRQAMAQTYGTDTKCDDMARDAIESAVNRIGELCV